jgi:predicted amidohydrolase
MKAHLVQLNMIWEQAAANREKVAQLMDKADVSPGDFVLLPEMFDTGFSMNTKATADKGETLQFLGELAAEFQVTVQGGRTIHDCHCAKASNVMTIVAPTMNASGSASRVEYRLVDQYAKIHPFSLGMEHTAFDGGSRVLTYEWVGAAASANDSAAAVSGATDARATDSPRLKVCPAICYDLRFPELFRLGLDQGAEAFALGACWPKTRQHHWRALLIARAIENQAFVFGVNRVGQDPNGAFGNGLEYIGGSIVVGPTGDVLGELGAEEAVMSVEIDPGAVKRWREKFPAWKDRKLK